MESRQGTTFDMPAGAAQRPARASVAVIAGQSPEVVELERGMELSLGRSRSSGLVIDDRSASRLHATLRWDGGDTVTLVDHDSRNGTWVGELRVGRAELVPGTEVRIGEVRLMVSVPPTAADPRMEPVDDDQLVAHDPVMLSVVSLADRAARSEVTVLLDGETGVGKEVVARRIHRGSARADGPFMAVSCGSIPETLAESTLFGHEKGAFTGASSRQVGLFEAAHGGTLFLDEVGELSASMQARLLRVLERREIQRVGAMDTIPVDVRVVAATNRDLPEAVRRGRCREDLLYRLDVLRISVPPLRQRPDDVVPLAERFLAERSTGELPRMAPDAIAALRAHGWPGNVRELRNVIDRAMAMGEGDVLRATDLFQDDGRSKRGGALRHEVGDLEKEAIVQALDQCGGNQTSAAKRLGISRRALIYKMERYGLKERPPSRRS